MLEAISGLTILGLMGLSAAVGIRLLRLGRRDGGGPELWLGLYFVIYGCLATTASITDAVPSAMMRA